MLRRTFFAAILTLISAGAQADTNIRNLNVIIIPQSDFRLLSEDLGAAFSYKAVAPAEPLGLTGFDIGLEATATKLENSAILQRASADNTSSTLVIPKLHIHKGLPLGLDIGAFYSSVPNSNIELWGAELRYALLTGSATTPAVAVRGSYTTLQGVDQLDFETKAIDVSISKGFTLLTPYAGIGKVWVDSTPDSSTGLRPEDFSYSKYFVGVNFNFGLINIAMETDKTGDATSYSAKFGWRF